MKAAHRSPGKTGDRHAESKAKPYTASDFRFTSRAGQLYAIQLTWPDNGKAVIASLQGRTAKRVSLVGADAPLAFDQCGARLTLTLPQEHAASACARLSD